MGGLIMKKCKKCKKEYPLSDFIKNKQCIDGYIGTCRKCRNKYGKKWKQKNKDRLAPIRRKQYAERYGEIQREKERIRRKQYPLKVRCQLLRSGMVERTRLRGLVFDSKIFTVKHLMCLLTNSPNCECCNKKLDISFKPNGSPNNDSPSIDRFNPELGYVESNVAILCWRCNNLKRDASAKELRRIADWMDNYEPGQTNKKLTQANPDLQM